MNLNGTRRKTWHFVLEPEVVLAQPWDSTRRPDSQGAGQEWARRKVACPAGGTGAAPHAQEAGALRKRAATREERGESVQVPDAERMWCGLACTPSGRGAAEHALQTARSGGKGDETENAQASGAASRRGGRRVQAH
ncbi:hypothetical protein FB451DRAFT_1172176 [Mycena latifolia]|nr:hypothetical protein FB451DRAFT_1172176 [Mycena latifolia]